MGITNIKSTTHTIKWNLFTELDAYSSVVSVFRAQGKLTKERRKTLQDLSNLLNVPIERHKAEVRRSINDELLNTVAAR